MSLHRGRVKDRGFDCVVDARVEGSQYHALVKCGGRSRHFEGPTGGAGISTIAVTVARRFVTGILGARSKKASPTKASGHRAANPRKGAPRVPAVLKTHANVWVSWSVPNQQWFVLLGRSVSNAIVLFKGSRPDVERYLREQAAATQKSLDAQRKFGGGGGERKPNHWALPLAVGVPAGAVIGHLGSSALTRAAGRKTNPGAVTWTRSNTTIHTWFERDRAHVELRAKPSGKTIIEFWDDDVQDMVDSGFIQSRDWHGSMVSYANYIKAGARKRNPRSVSVPTARDVGRATGRGARSLARGVSAAARSAWRGGREFAAGLREKNARRSTSDADVLRAFVAGNSAQSRKLTSTGRRLDGNWMGGRGIAEWQGGKIAIFDLGSRAAQSVQRALGKAAPGMLKYGTKTKTNPSRKDYEATAAILKSAPAECRKPLTQAFAKHFAADNAAFKPALFARAAGVSSNPPSCICCGAIGLPLGKGFCRGCGAAGCRDAIGTCQSQRRGNPAILETVNEKTGRRQYFIDGRRTTKERKDAVVESARVHDTFQTTVRGGVIRHYSQVRSNGTARCNGCRYDVPRANPGGKLVRHRNPRTGAECRGNPLTDAEVRTMVGDVYQAMTHAIHGPGKRGNPKQASVGCKRCKGARSVKLGKNVIPCPSCCRKGKVA